MGKTFSDQNRIFWSDIIYVYNKIKQTLKKPS